MKKIRRRNKQKYHRLFRMSQVAQMSMSDLMKLIDSMNDLKQSSRLRKRYGEQYNWNELDAIAGVFVTVPIHIKGRLSSYRVIFSEEDVPNEYREKYRALTQDKPNDIEV